ncbi:MAG: phosphoenolpyruvate synthase [Actinomycetota bacterium]|nr:phosphoenolpyruvate synthase [Actinomycetota bacterium]
MAYIVQFQDVGKDDVRLVGGKGANLGEMTRAGMPVPPGFIITSRAYFSFLDISGLAPQIKQLLANLDYNDNQALGRVSNAIKHLIISAEIPMDMAKEIKAAYRRLSGPEDIYVAVRSSATAEDLPKASFAGQQVTLLNVKGEDAVVDAVRRVWASLFEARAIFYRHERGFDHFKIGIAVPVQKMVESEKSGVMFTVEPLTNDREKIEIEAIFGLGEAIVTGQVTPDIYLVRKSDLQIVDKRISSQPWKIELKEGRNQHVEIPQDRRSMQKLTDEEILGLARYGIILEEHYNFPQDAEWAIEGGNIYLVQTRPITTLAPVEKAEVKEKAGEVILEGIAASAGMASGIVKIVRSKEELDKVKKGDVLVTPMTNPDFVPAMRRAVAIVTDSGGRTSHASIVSRELGIPCVVGTGKATQVLKDGDVITVDGARGIVYSGEIKAKALPEKRAEEAVPVTAGVPITATKVYVNLAEPELADQTAALPVDGVGLLRAEFMIAGIGTHPRKFIDEGRQEEFIDKLSEGLKTFAQAFYPRPVVYRTTDFKTNEYRELAGGDRYEPSEANPMIGYRGVSRYIKEADVFKMELAAIKKVRNTWGLKNVWVMLPFVRKVAEVEDIKKVMEEEGLKTSADFKLWIMIEVPSTVLLIEDFCKVGIDGISIGSNDLTQLILGIDRDSELLAPEFDERDPSVMQAMFHVIEVCRRYGVTTSICGQAPSVYPEITEALVQHEITSVSVNPDAVSQTRRLIASTEQRMILDFLEKLRERGQAA